MKPILPLALLSVALGFSPGRAQSPAPASGIVALTLGRIPLATPAQIRLARDSLLSLSRLSEGSPEAQRIVVRALETLTRLTWRTEPLEPDVVTRLTQLARAPGEEHVRRHALGALLLAQIPDSITLAALLESADEQTRRLAVTGLPRLPEGAARNELLGRAYRDPSPMVRIEGMRAGARTQGTSACPVLRAAARDTSLRVALVGIELLSSCVGDTAAADVLLDALVTDRRESWHRSAQALVSLAKVFPEGAREFLPDAMLAPVWQVRMYAARTAVFLKDSVALRGLAADSVANVREAAVSGLTVLVGHAADSIYRAALASPDCQLVLSAAKALAGTPARAEAVAEILRALQRIAALQWETSRDARVGLLVRLRELGTPGSAPSLRPSLADFDPVIADSAAAILTAWTGQPQRARPRRLAPVVVSRAEVDSLRGKQLRFTMASGRSFDVGLYPDDAPETVARIGRLVRRKYYDGLTWHRFVPNFVIQGGSPGANEYAGAARFMRDELGPLSHDRGTLGISTRGRDTGDAQMFINLVDNPRLDYDYTVWGRVLSGLDVVDGLLEGDVILRVEFR